MFSEWNGVTAGGFDSELNKIRFLKAIPDAPPSSTGRELKSLGPAFPDVPSQHQLDMIGLSGLF